MPRLLTAYRIIAYVTGVGLLVLVLLGVPLKYLGDDDSVVAVVGPLHGFLYMVYVVIALAMAYSRRWSILRTLVTLLAGTIPFAVFFVERRVVADERAARSEGSVAAEQPGERASGVAGEARVVRGGSEEPNATGGAEHPSSG